MQDRYTGDVGDFGKYGMLRALTGVHPPGQVNRLGVVWYRTSPEAVADRPEQKDGKHRAYLSKGRAYAGCDPALFQAMQVFLDPSQRAVGALPETGLFPEDTVWFDEELSFAAVAAGDRALHRDRWFARALEATRPCSVVFLDPDNGLMAKSVRPKDLTGPKFVAIEEARAFLDRGQSLVVYHHIGRTGGTAEEQARTQLDRLGCEDSFAVLFRRGTVRAFLVAPSPDQAHQLGSRADQLLQGPWAEHYNPTTPLKA